MQSEARVSGNKAFPHLETRLAGARRTRNDGSGTRGRIRPPEIERMSYVQLNLLSHAEKYDIIIGGSLAGWSLWIRESQAVGGCPAGVGAPGSCKSH